jgi:tetratricopeptide (TPR) repeat protein
MIWQIVGLIILFLTIRLYRFSRYIKKHLVPYEIKILSNDKTGDFYKLDFVAVFGKGYFKREYINVIGNFKSKNFFSVQMLKEMLTLTEIENFYDRKKADEVEYKYTYFQSFGEASSDSNSGEFIVSYSIVNQAGIDFATSMMGNSERDDSLSYYQSGVTKFKRANYKGAIDDISKAIDLRPNIGDMYFDRAGARKKLGDHKGAIGDYTKAIELNPNDADAYSARGYSRAALKDYQGAVDDASKAIEIKPDHVDAKKTLEFFADKKF